MTKTEIQTLKSAVEEYLYHRQQAAEIVAATILPLIVRAIDEGTDSSQIAKLIGIDYETLRSIQ